MKEAMNNMVQDKNDNMRAEYDFTSGARGRHYHAMQAGYTIIIHKADGSTVIKEIMPKKGSVMLAPDIIEYFPDSEAVNKALRCLIPLLQKKREINAEKA